ncbi:MAG: potassium channel family protein, partial [Ilumatobacteraceae bacterium]
VELVCDSLDVPTEEQLTSFDEEFAVDSPTATKAIIIGGGRVGRAAARALSDDGVDVTIIDRLPERKRSHPRYVIGDAANRAILDQAGIADAGAILITTHDDSVNVYLTRYCRGLRPDARIVSRSNLGRNVTTLYRAGADAVLSYAGTGSSTIWNHFRGDETLLVAQGLNIFRTPVPGELAGSSLAESHVYRRTNCNVVAIEQNGVLRGNPDAQQPLPADGELLLVGTDAAEEKFSRVFPHARRRPIRTRLRR